MADAEALAELDPSRAAELKEKLGRVRQVKLGNSHANSDSLGLSGL